MVWVKPGASQNDFSKDKYSCTQQAQQRVSSAAVDAFGGTANNKVITNQEIYSSCMNSNGWYLKNQEDAQRQIQSQQYQQTDAKQQQAQKLQQTKSQMDQMTKERNDLCEKEEYKVIYAKSSCRSENLTLEQLSDSTKISPENKPLFMRLNSDSTTLRKKFVTLYRSSGIPAALEFASLVDRTGNRREKNSLDLYEGKISWGEYNKTRKEIDSSSREEAATITWRK